MDQILIIPPPTKKRSRSESTAEPDSPTAAQPNEINATGTATVAPPAVVTPVMEPAAVTPAMEPATVTPAMEPAAVTPAMVPAAVTPAMVPATVTPAMVPAVVTPVVEPAASAEAAHKEVDVTSQDPSEPPVSTLSNAAQASSKKRKLEKRSPKTKASPSKKQRALKTPSPSKRVTRQSSSSLTHVASSTSTRGASSSTAVGGVANVDEEVDHSNDIEIVRVCIPRDMWNDEDTAERIRAMFEY